MLPAATCRGLGEGEKSGFVEILLERLVAGAVGLVSSRRHRLNAVRKRHDPVVEGASRIGTVVSPFVAGQGEKTLFDGQGFRQPSQIMDFGVQQCLGRVEIVVRDADEIDVRHVAGEMVELVRLAFGVGREC